MHRGSAREALSFISIVVIVSLFSPRCARGQAQPGPDVLVLVSGERLTGHLQDAQGGSVDFQSDGLGKIAVPWIKIQELRTAEPFAVIRNNVILNRNININTVPQGTIAATSETITLTPPNAPPQTISVADVSTIVSEADFVAAIQEVRTLLQDWTGTASFGAALIAATQSSVSVASSVSLLRQIPTESWLPPDNRTIVDFNSAYGRISQPATPVVKTSIIHADAQRDEYFRDDIYALANIAFDHNFSEGLDLQQIYGGGVGWTVLKNPVETLSVQGSLTFERQSFFVPSLDRNLVGSIFSEAYNRKFNDGITLTQKLALNPAWNVPQAYSMNAGVIVAIPLYKHFSFSTTLAESFLNDPPPGFQKNSFQFITAIGYTFGAK